MAPDFAPGDFAPTLQRQIQFVTGKGGVGKSLVSCSLATGFARTGLRTLLAQINAKDSHGPLLGTGAIGEEIRVVERYLSVVNVAPQAAMKEYALMTLKFEALYHAVFENRLTRAFLRMVPSLSELTMMGKLWFHAEERDGGRPRFDRIVIDAPSTGHALKLLQTSRVLADAVRVGPMADKTRAMAETFKDPARMAVHLVTLPEELPVNETLEFLALLERSRVATPGGIVVNQVLPRLFDGIAKAAFKTLPAQPQLAPVRAVAARRLAREDNETEQERRLRASGLPIATVPMIFDGPLKRAHVDRVAALLQLEVR